MGYITMEIYTILLDNVIPVKLVTAKASYGIGFLTSFVGGFCALFGIPNNMYSKKIKKAETLATQELETTIKSIGADGVMDVRCQIDGLSFLITGTAYKWSAEERAKREAEERAKREAEAKARHEAELKAQREATEKERRKAEEIKKYESEMRKKLLSNKTPVTKTILPMNKPNNFQNNPDWQNDIAILSNNEIYIRYIDEEDWSEAYRYHCYLELKKRGLQSIQIIANHSEEQNELKIFPNGKGYICPLCGFSNTNFSSCAQCSYNPFESQSEETDDSEDKYVDIACPACGEMLSFLKNETKGVCPNCDTEFEIK